MQEDPTVPTVSNKNKTTNNPTLPNNGLQPVPLVRVGQLPRPPNKIPGIIIAPAPPKRQGGARRTRRKHKKARKTHRRRH